MVDVVKSIRKPRVDSDMSSKCFYRKSFFFIRCTGRHTDTPRQQVNKLTSYIDGSVVYGESEMRNGALREFKDGKMKLGPDGLIPVRWSFRPHYSSTFFDCESRFTFFCQGRPLVCAHDPSLSPLMHGRSQTEVLGVEWRQGSEPAQAGLSLLHPLDKTLP